MTPETQQLLTLLGSCLIAFLGGVALVAFGARKNAARLRASERELEAARQDLDQYRQRVSEHFDGTSKLLHDLTLQYRAVYEHLAQGAESLCPEGSNLLAPSLAQAALPEAAVESAEPEAGASVAAPTPDVSEDEGVAESLEPLLDPEPPAPDLAKAEPEARL